MMMDPTLSFYDALADHYHLIFNDWDRAIDRQGQVLSAILAAHDAGAPLKILDCACGIGTQSIALARLGHRVTGSDISPAAADRARKEAGQRSHEIDFYVSDMTSLLQIPAKDFDVVVALDNAIPHLHAEQIPRAAEAIKSVLKPGGLFMASIRDYDRIILEKPTIQPPAFYSDNGGRRIVHQVWDWIDRDRYVLHLYITLHTEAGWKSHHFVSEYHCLLREQLSSILREAGFTNIEWKMPDDTGFYQLIVMATSPL
jgi:glycine/sarcosine N-methyltransferase